MAKIEEEFQCPICLELAENAVETKCCNHAYCEEHAKTIAAGGGKCPTCRATPFRYRPAVIVRRLINNLPTECPLCKSSSIQRGNLEDHKKTCSERPATSREPHPEPPPPQNLRDGETAAAQLQQSSRRVIARLSLSRRIPPDALRRPNETRVLLWGLCGGAAAHELFLTDEYSAVRVFDVRTGRLDASDAYTPPNGERVRDVAYSAESDSLFVATRHADGSGDSVRSLARRTDGQWSECHRMQLAPEGNNWIRFMICLGVLRILRDGTLLYSQCNTDGIHVCRTHSDRSLQHCARVALPANHRGFDAQLAGNERRLAAAFSDGSVALFRVDTERAALVQLSRVILAGARNALFCGDSLLVGVDTDGFVWEAVSFTTTDGRLQRDRQLIPSDDRFDIFRWCFVEGTLFVWDFTSNELLLFNAA